MELDEKAGQALMNLKLTGEMVSKETADSLTGTFAQMGESITEGMERTLRNRLPVCGITWRQVTP